MAGFIAFGFGEPIQLEKHTQQLVLKHHYSIRAPLYTSPDMFWYTDQIPVINVHVSLGISNGKEGKAFGFIIDPASKVYKIVHQGQCDFNIVD